MEKQKKKDLYYDVDLLKTPLSLKVLDRIEPDTLECDIYYQ